MLFKLEQPANASMSIFLIFASTFILSKDVAKGYWMGSSIGAKMLLKIVFKPYPVMKETVSNLDTKEFYKDPISLIRTFDSLLK